VESAENSVRVLVVDDDPGLQKLVTTLLDRAGMQPISAITATDAAKVLRQPPLPHVIVLDLMLPDISGIECIGRPRPNSGRFERRGRPLFDQTVHCQ